MIRQTVLNVGVIQECSIAVDDGRVFDLHLLEEFLKPLGLSQVQAAQRMGIPLNRLNEVVRGKRGITADTALRLARLLDTSPQFWMSLQTASDLYHAALLTAVVAGGALWLLL